MANHELSKAEWLSKAEAYCARAEHCAADVRRKLFEWQAPSKTADFSPADGLDLFDFIEQKLRENDFINDTRFCRAYVHDKVEYQAWGRLKIKAGLQALQLPDSAIREALDSIDESKYFANLRYLIEQHSPASSDKVKTKANANAKDSEDKLLRFLLQRGFTYDEIKSKQ